MWEDKTWSAQRLEITQTDELSVMYYAESESERTPHNIKYIVWFWSGEFKRCRRVSSREEYLYADSPMHAVQKQLGHRGRHTLVWSLVSCSCGELNSTALGDRDTRLYKNWRKWRWSNWDPSVLVAECPVMRVTHLTSVSSSTRCCWAHDYCMHTILPFSNSVGMARNSISLPSYFVGGGYMQSGGGKAVRSARASDHRALIASCELINAAEVV